MRQVEGILKLLVMPKGLKAGQSLYECTLGYQWLFYVAVFCTVHRDEPERRRYETAVLEICRKNFKTYTCGTAFIISFLLEPPFSKFFSVAPDGALSREVRDAISETLKSSPKVYRRKGRPRFRILRDYIMFSPTESKYVPLNYATNRFDGRLPNVFLADEVGALPNNSAIEAMRSGQLNVLNKLGCVVSTKYPDHRQPPRGRGGLRQARAGRRGGRRDGVRAALRARRPEALDDRRPRDAAGQPRRAGDTRDMGRPREEEGARHFGGVGPRELPDQALQRRLPGRWHRVIRADRRGDGGLHGRRGLRRAPCSTWAWTSP